MIHETIETVSGLHTMQALTLDQLAALIRAAFTPSVADAMLGQSSSRKIEARADGPKQAASDTGSLRAAKLRTLADAMQKDIDAKMNPATANQNLTRRRMGIIDGMRRDAERLEQAQHALYALADAHDNGTPLPYGLGELASRKATEDLYHEYSPTGERAHAQYRLKQMAASYKPINAEEREAELLQRGIREREKRAAMASIPGYFPTPAALCARLVSLADIKPGMLVLEPSAGSGHLADEIMRQCPAAVLRVCERNQTLLGILADKGYTAIPADDDNFLNYSARTQLDRVVMNPPFENGLDIDHVRHAYSLLKPGGVLAAIMCEGPFYREDAKSRQFRGWLTGTAAGEKELPPSIKYNERNPDGSFEKSDRPTGVATRTLVLRKPA